MTMVITLSDFQIIMLLCSFQWYNVACRRYSVVMVLCRNAYR